METKTKRDMKLGGYLEMKSGKTDGQYEVPANVFTCFTAQKSPTNPLPRVFGGSNSKYSKIRNHPASKAVFHIFKGETSPSDRGKFSAPTLHTSRKEILA